jgi:hypothetical protein
VVSGCFPFSLPRLAEDFHRVYAAPHSSNSGGEGHARASAEILTLALMDLASDEAPWGRLLSCVQRAAAAEPGRAGALPGADEAAAEGGVDGAVPRVEEADVDATGGAAVGEDMEGDGEDVAQAAVTLLRLCVSLLPPPAVSASPLLFRCGTWQAALPFPPPSPPLGSPCPYTPLSWKTLPIVVV